MKLKELKEVLKSYNKILIGLGSNSYSGIDLDRTLTDWQDILDLKKKIKDPSPINNLLSKILQNKDCFILSSAWDSHLVKIESDRLFTPNGTLEKLQCYEACTQDLWDIDDFIDHKDSPRCPNCNSPLVLNIKTDAFFINSHLKTQEDNYYRWIHNNYNEKLLIIEIESSEKDIRLIRQPFENISAALPNTFFIRVNSSYLYIPEIIKDSGSLKSKPLSFLKLIS